MELELGLKITRTREDVSSSVDFRFSKDPFGPLVLSRETDSRFIIIIHLKGFKKEGIEIEINKEGNRITIRGRKPVEEMVLIRWMAWRKEVELRAFRKVFLIPDVVDLDKIKARFDDDDSTLTITMPKRVKGISGLKIEEEEEEEEDVSQEAVNREETENREEVDEDDVESVKSDERSETEIRREEEFGEIMGDKERESQVLEGEEEGFSGGLDEEESEDNNIEKIHQTDQQNKILEFKEDEKIGQPEVTDSNTKSEESSLRELPDIQEERDSHEQTRNEEQENNQELVSQAETKSDDTGSRSFGEIEQELDEQLDTTSTSGEMEKKTTNDDCDDGSSKVQGIKEPERRNEERKIQEMVEGEAGGLEKKKIVKMERKRKDVKEEVNGKTGEGVTKTIEKTQVDGEDDDIAETKTKAELGSDELEADKVDKIDELVEKKEAENAKLGRQSENRSLIKLQENAEQHSKGQKEQGKQERLKELVEEKIPEAETNVVDDTSRITGDKEKQEKEEKKIVKMDMKNGDEKREVDAKLGDGSAPKILETETLKADEEENIQKLDEKKEENALLGTQTEEKQLQRQKQHEKQEKLKEMVEEQIPEAETDVAADTLEPVQERDEGENKIQKLFHEETKTQPEEYKEKIMETREKMNDAGARKVLEIIRQQELVEPERFKKESKTRELVKSKTNDEEKEVAERETKVRGSNRPTILGEQEEIQELADEKTNFSERVNEKKTEVGDDYISRKVGDIKQREEDTVKGEEEKDKTKLEQGEKVSDVGKGIIAVSETIAENYESRKVQEIDEQQSHKEETCGNQKLRGEASGRQEVEDLENEKKTTEAEKRIKDSTREAQEIEKKDSDLSGKYIKGTTIQQLEENRGIHQNKHEEENKSEADRLEKITGRIEQELFNLNSQLEQKNIEGQRTQELTEEKPKDYKEEEAGKVQGSDKSKTKTSDDVVRKVQETKEQELYEPKREHVSKTKELIKEKETAESEIEAEFTSLRKVDDSEGQELHQPKIHKERDKTLSIGTGKPSGQEIEEQGEIIESETMAENENSTYIQETEEKQSEKSESHEKRHKIQEVVETGHDDRKEEQRAEKVVAKEGQETEEDSSKKVQEIENQENDEVKGSMVQEKRKETEETVETRAMEGKEMVERRTITKDGSLRKVQDDDFLELSKSHKRQEEDKIQELVEMGTSDYREKVKKLQDVSDILRNQEAERPNLDESKRHSEQRNIPQLVEDDSSRKPYSDWTHEEQKKRQELVKEEATDSKDENVIAKAELKTEEDNLKKVQKTEKQECDDLKRSVVHDKTQETEEKDKMRAMEAKDIVERKKKTKDSFLGKVRDDDFPEPSKFYERQEERKVQELMESDHREKVKKQDVDDMVRGQEAERPDLIDFEKNSEQRSISELVEDDSSSKLHELEELKSYEEWTHEEREKLRDSKEEATDPKDKYTSGEVHNEEENVIPKAELKTEEEDISKVVEETEQQEYDNKMQETEDKGKTRAMEENEIVERREKTKDDSLRKVREDESPELDKHKKHGEVDRIQELVETVISDHKEKIKKKDEDDNLRRQEIHQSVEDEKGEGKLESISEPGGKMEGASVGKLHDFQKQRSYENWRPEKSEEVENIVKGEATYPKDKQTGGREHEEATKIQETEEEEELYESERHEKLDIVKDFVEDKTEDQKNEEAEEAAAVVAENEKESPRKFQTIQEQESGKHKEQYKIPKMSDPEVKEEDEGRVSEKKRKEKGAHVQELKLSRHKKHGEVDMTQESVETVISDHKEKFKKKYEDDMLRRQERVNLESGGLERQRKERKIHQSVEDEKGEGKLESISEPGGKMEGDSLDKLHDFQKQRSFETWRQEESEEVKNLVKGEATYPKDKHTGGEEHEEERYEKVAQNETKAEDEINKKAGENKEPEYKKLDRLEEVPREAARDRKNEENLVDDLRTEKEELLEMERYEKLDIVEDIVEDEKEDQKNVEAEEAAAAEAEKEKGSSKKVQTIEEQESGKHKKQYKIPKMRVQEVKKEDEERVSGKERKEKETHVQELQGKTKRWKDGNSEGRRGEQQKTVKSKSDDRIPREILENKVQESNENKNQESKDKIEELEREETNNHETKLVNEDDSLRRGQEFLEKDSNVSKVRPVEQKKIQELKEVEKREDKEKAAVETKINDDNSRKVQMSEVLELDESEEKEEVKKIQEPMGEEKWGPEKQNGKIAEEEMQDEIKEQELYELLRNEDHKKSPEHTVKGTKYHTEEEKEMEERDIEAIKKKTEKISEVQESDNIKDSMEEKIQENREGEMKEGGGYKCTASSESQDVEEKESYQLEQELKTEKNGKEECDIREGEKMEKAKSWTEILRGQKKKEKHQEVLETGPSDPRKEENEKDLVWKAETIYEDDSSRKINGQEKGNSDRVERESEATRKSEDYSSRKVQQIKAEESEKHRKLSEVQDNENIEDSVEEKIQEHKDGKMKEGEGYKHMSSGQSQDVEDKGSYRPEQDAEQVKIQELKNEKDGKEDCDTRGEQKEKAKRIPQVESIANDDSSRKNESEIMRGKKKKEKHQEVVETGTSDQRTEEDEEDDLVQKADIIERDDSSRKIHEHEKGYADKVERREEEEMRGNIAEEETNVDKEGNRTGAVWGEGETQNTNGGFGKVREIIEQEQDNKKPLLEEKFIKGKEKKHQETKSRDDSSRKTQANEKEKSNVQNRNEEQDENYCINEEDGKEDEEIAEAEMVERHENRDSNKELVEEKMDNQDKEDKKSMITKELAKGEDHETKGHEGLRKQDQSKELEQRLSENLKDEETASTETKGSDNESRKIHQIKEQEKLEEQGSVKELVEEKTHSYRETESEDGNSKKIREIDKQESIEPGGDEQRDKIQEPVDRETSEDEEEELEIEFEEEEEEWEAEVIQEMDSDEANKLRQIRSIKLGFRLVGGSALFMSFIVIVIRFIHSKRKIRCYKL